MEIQKVFNVILHGLSQIMLQRNALTGSLFLLGILFSSFAMAAGALLGAVCSTAAAILFRYDKKDIEDGLYGFNGALTGIALFFFFEISIYIVVLVMLGSALSSFIMNFMRKRNLPPYTFPFILSAWLMMFLAEFFNAARQEIVVSAQAAALDIFSSFANSFSQVMFQSGIITGIIFLIAILINSRLSAAYAGLASVAGILFAVLLSLPVGMINNGFYCFNAVLCAVAFADKRISSLVCALLSAVLSVIVMHFMSLAGITALTAPFVISVWLFSWLRLIYNNMSIASKN